MTLPANRPAIRISYLGPLRVVNFSQESLRFDDGTTLPSSLGRANADLAQVNKTPRIRKLAKWDDEVTEHIISGDTERDLNALAQNPQIDLILVTYAMAQAIKQIGSPISEAVRNKVRVPLAAPKSHYSDAFQPIWDE